VNGNQNGMEWNLKSSAVAPGPLSQTVDQLGRLGLGQIRRAFLASLPSERLKVAVLRPGHRLVAGDPVVGVLLGRAHRCVSHALPYHFALPLKHRCWAAVSALQEVVGDQIWLGECNQVATR
jgi:hypothetical protein